MFICKYYSVSDMRGKNICRIFFYLDLIKIKWFFDDLHMFTFSTFKVRFHFPSFIPSHPRFSF